MKEAELRKILSTNIKRYRSRREWSQAKLAENIEISTNFLSDIETGKGWVSPATLVKLANTLNIKVYELFKEEVPDTDTGGVKELMAQFVNDISIALSQSMSRSISDTLNKILIKSLNDSLENVFKQYFHE
ncbi:helix-turn-helix domain-containing protein [Breznakiellaceae bacterium SP9]